MKKIVKSFNILIKKTIFKVQNKTNNNFKISIFNKHLIALIGLLFFYLFYLLIPLLYDKTWVQTNIESKLQNEFKINFSPSAEISYRILPAPHFLIKDSKILVGESGKQKSIAEIKDLKVFVGQGNFIDKEKLSIKEIIIEEANFTLLRNDLKIIRKFKKKKFSNKKIKINNSNIFFKDNLDEIISIINIDKTTLFFDSEKKINLFNLMGKIFNVPFTFNYKSQHDLDAYEEISFNSKSLNLNIFNESTKKNNLISGNNVISFFNSSINTKYDIEEKLINFESDKSRVNNLQVDYNGELSINPFDLSLKIYLDKHRVSKFFNINPVLIEFIKSGLLFNNNISINTSIIINSNTKNEVFQNAKINFNIFNGKIDLNKTKLTSEDIGTLELSNSNLFIINNELIFNSDILIDVKDSDRIFSFLNTSKSSRKNFNNISINLNYNFFNNKIEFNNVKIDDNDVNTQLLRIIEGFEGNDLNNFNKSRRLINQLLKAYAG